VNRDAGETDAIETEELMTDNEILRNEIPPVLLRKRLRNEPNATERERIATLERRVKYLDKWIEEAKARGQDRDWAEAERAALLWSLSVVRMWTVGFNQRLIERIEVVDRNVDRRVDRKATG
jgi:hypothetical protein